MTGEKRLFVSNLSRFKSFLPPRCAFPEHGVSTCYLSMLTFSFKFPTKKHNFPMRIPGSQNLGSRLIYVNLLPKFVDLRNSQKLVNLGRFVTQGKTKLVFECELLPYLLSLQLWAAVLPHSDLLVFIDNDSARRTLRKAFTKEAEGAHILLQAVVCEEHLSTRAAFLRVPTHSNIADGPSRDVFDIPLALGGRRVPLPEGCIAHALGLSEVLQGGEVTSLEPRRGEEHVELT